VSSLRYLLSGSVILVLAAYCFFPEMGAMVWHIRHASNTDFRGLRLHVPALYSAKIDETNGVIYIMSVPGWARTYLRNDDNFKVSLISIHQLSIGEHGVSLDDVKDPWAARGYLRNFDANVKMAGNPGKCVGYSGPATWSGHNDVQIWCQFASGLQVVFTGTEPGSTDFFNILKSAKAVEGNR
jgi:hypothetical protein